jgi:hypothetical protein
VPTAAPTPTTAQARPLLRAATSFPASPEEAPRSTSSPLCKHPCRRRPRDLPIASRRRGPRPDR